MTVLDLQAWREDTSVYPDPLRHVPLEALHVEPCEGCRRSTPTTDHGVGAQCASCGHPRPVPLYVPRFEPGLCSEVTVWRNREGRFVAACADRCGWSWSYETETAAVAAGKAHTQ